MKCVHKIRFSTRIERSAQIVLLLAGSLLFTGCAFVVMATTGDVSGVNITPVVTQVVSPPAQSVSSASSAPTGTSK